MQAAAFVAQGPGRRSRALGEALRAPRDGRRARPRRGRRRRARASLRAWLTSSRTSASAAWVGVEHEAAATSSISVRSTSWPTALITGRRSIATVRQRFSSQNAHRSLRLPPPRQTTATSTAGSSARPRSAAPIAPAARRSCTGASAQTIVPRQPRRSSPASRSAQAALPRAVTTPIVRGSSGRCSAPCLTEQPLGIEAPAGPLELGEQVALAREPDVRGPEAEARRRGLAARVVVGPSGDHDLGTVPERALGQLQPLEVRVPDRTARRALGVAQLEVGAGAGALEVEDLAEDQHPRALAQEVLKGLRPPADGERPRQVGVFSRCRLAAEERDFAVWCHARILARCPDGAVGSRGASSLRPRSRQPPARPAQLRERGTGARLATGSRAAALRTGAMTTRAAARLPGDAAGARYPRLEPATRARTVEVPAS